MIWVHALRNAAIAPLTYFGVIAGAILTGSVVIEPQMQNIDAWARQITTDQSLQYLPAALQTIRLYEAGGNPGESGEQGNHE